MTNATRGQVRAVRLFISHRRRLRLTGRATEKIMGLLVALQRAERVWEVR